MTNLKTQSPNIKRSSPQTGKKYEEKTTLNSSVHLAYLPFSTPSPQTLGIFHPKFKCHLPDAIGSDFLTCIECPLSGSQFLIC